jgi:hypothetical protein
MDNNLNIATLDDTLASIVYDKVGYISTQKYRDVINAYLPPDKVGDMLVRLNKAFLSLFEQYENTTEIRILLLDDDYEIEAYIDLFKINIFPKLQEVLNL